MRPMIEHPLRRQVVGEMHLRRWPPVAAPGLAIQVLRLVEEADRQAEADWLANPPSGWTLGPSESPRHHEGQCGDGAAWVWEQHKEASTFTLFLPGSDPASLAMPQSDTALGELLDPVAGLPGKVIRATQIMVVPDQPAAEALLPRLAFVADELVSVWLGDEAGPQARIWSDFRIAEGQFGRLLIAANGVPPAELARLIQRLQELGNYRNLSLLGLPLARQGWQVLDRVESELVDLAGEVSRSDLDDETMLERVCAVSLELTSQATAASFRMSATAAYASLVDERLAELAPRPIPGFQSLADFTQRRLHPAVRTCAALVRREAELSDRAALYVSLLRTRIETRIEGQNARLLESMERSAGLQLRMQQLVEGLSVVALSYYCLGLLGYLLKGAEAVSPAFPAYQTLALATPLVVALVALGLYRLKHSLLKEEKRK